jgi:uncharacterized cupredoxin-like copper-binding protein
MMRFKQYVERYFFGFGLTLLILFVGLADFVIGSDPLMTIGTPVTVSVELKEGSVMPDKRSISHAGRVTFKVKNTGTVAHEMVILKTDLPADALPVAEGKVNEEAAGKVIDEIEEFPPNTEKQITLDLSAGHYVLFCNVVERGQTDGHYQKGMRAAFTVGSDLR